MAPLSKLAILFILSIFFPSTTPSCTSQNPFFPPPIYSRQSSEIWETFSQIEASLSALTRNNSALNTSSYSIEVTSSHKTLWSTFHTARDKNLTRPGAETVDETSRYRIASITKVFTVLGILQQHAAGNLSLDDSVDKYIPDLFASLGQPAGAPIPWHEITLRSLASQLSGLPRDWAQSDLYLDLDDPTSIGLPPIPPSAPELGHLPTCDSYKDYKPCTARDLLENLHHRPLVFAPNTKSTYSNIAFELLGLVLANVTGQTYEDAIQKSILAPLKMSQSSFAQPPDDVAVLPKSEAWYFDVDEGVQNPTGGLYCSSSSMSTFLRHILQTYKNIAGSKVNWLLPVSFTPGLNGFYGMPWEIFRTDNLLLSAASTDSKRTVTFYTKGGGLPGYSTNILLVPEYDLGITVFTAGNPEILGEVLERVTVPLMRAADALAARQMRERYAGTYTSAARKHGDKKLNSTMTLAYSAAHGLEITHWISNGTDMMAIIPVSFDLPRDRRFHAQLIPTFLHRDYIRERGEKWRVALLLEADAKRKLWDDFCVSDVDTMLYAGMPLNEFVFWDDDGDKGKSFGTLELTAFRINLTRSDADARCVGDGNEKVLVQKL